MFSFVISVFHVLRPFPNNRLEVSRRIRSSRFSACDSSAQTPPASRSSPPRVKSSFYKRPSKAIEKGGGFYIPGLRGPRLRVAVGIAILGLLIANGISASTMADVETSMWVSEAFGLSGAAFVLFGAVADLKAEDAGKVEEERTDRSVGTVAEVFDETQGRKAGKEKAGGNEFMQELEWTAAVITDLTPATSLVLCENDRLVFHEGSIRDESRVGKVVQRVGQENKALYVSDTSSLPGGVNVPFLEESSPSSVFLQPLADGKLVFVVAAPSSRNQEEPTFGTRERAWMFQLGKRLEQVYQNTSNSSLNT